MGCVEDWDSFSFVDIASGPDGNFLGSSGPNPVSSPTGRIRWPIGRDEAFFSRFPLQRPEILLRWGLGAATVAFQVERGLSPAAAGQNPSSTRPSAAPF